MKPLTFAYLIATFAAISGALPDAISDFLLMIVLGTAPLYIMVMLLEPPKKSIKCPPHVWSKDSPMRCTECGYTPR